jgi:predicted phage terminase large subunit-like protein
MEEVRRDTDAVRARCATLTGFIREAWHVVEPNNRYVEGWHVGAIGEHLEAITRGQLNRLLINVPPGTMKSLLSSVLWPAWEWGPQERGSLRYLSTSYADHLCVRDTRRMRDLVMSEWYRTLWPHIRLTRSGERSFENTLTGKRDGVAFASLTGGRGDRVIIDDPHSTETAESDVERAKTTRIFRESVPTRLNSPEHSAIVIIMQRLHSEDVSGQALSLDLGYEHLCLPMEYEADRGCTTRIGFKDPRTHDGDLLFPARFPREVVERDKRPMGEYAVAGQFQQRPVPREGGLFKRTWFEDCFVPAAPAGVRWVRHWDLAASTQKTSAFTAGVKIGRAPDGVFYVGHVARARASGDEVRSLIRMTAETDGKACHVSLPQDPGQAGKVQAADFIRRLAGWNVSAEPETGDKITRAEPFAAQCAAGNVKLVKGEWNAAYLDELCLFPGGSFKDQVDASSGAFGRLVRYGHADNRIGAAIQVGAGPR